MWERNNGHISLLLEAGKARHPSGKWVQMHLPYGAKPRLILAYLNTQAIRQQQPVINVEATLYAFIRKLGLDTGGRTMGMVKEQLARLAAADMRLGLSTGTDSATTRKGTIVAEFNLWLERNEKQRIMWPRTVTLDERYFRSLVEHAVPLDDRALASLSHSAMAIDCYAWLAQRLHRIGADAFIPWAALYNQFGEGFRRIRDFRRKFLMALKQVREVYPNARLSHDHRGLTLSNSPPPVAKRQVLLSGRAA
jgi:hypothetical protein